MRALLALREGRRCVGSCTPLGKKDEAEEVVEGGYEAANEKCAWRGLACRRDGEKSVEALGEEGDYIFTDGRFRGGEGRITVDECAVDYFCAGSMIETVMILGFAVWLY